MGNMYYASKQHLKKLTIGQNNILSNQKGQVNTCKNISAPQNTEQNRQCKILL